MPFSVASSLPRPSTLTCASVRFSVIDRCGNSSKCWNTIPTFERSFDRFVFLSPTDWPFTRISPC